MKIVDNNNIPSEIMLLLTHDDYDHEAAKGTITATTFNKPTKEIVLTERHDEEIEVEAADCLWRVLGSGVHKVLEEAVNRARLTEFFQTEERLYGEILGQKVSSRFDLVRERMSDYKVTSSWTRVFGSRDEEWKRQESINRYLYNVVYKRMLPDIANLIVIYRDWSAKEYERNSKKGYPERPFELIEIDLYSLEETKKLMEGKVKAIQEARKLKDDDLPDCTDEERWKNWSKKLNKEVFNKCEKYCNAYKFCKQSKEREKKAKKEV